ncbi:MAG: CDP-alcohol phosphatidyltransferase family protein [Spirochaetaceae bacterium]|nr:CDP-alcohol phosphatidyltransferase family protein [Spirochaetaceae bacterium]
MANIITSLRILISVALLFCPTFSPVFYVFYLSAGFSDMIDGTVARRTNTASEFGAKLDTAADFVFAAVCMLKLLPKMLMPLWLYIWIAGIAAIKAFNIAAGFIRQKYFPAVHSIMNKLTGGMLFVLPLTIKIIDLKYSAAIVCAAATFAAIQESRFIMKLPNSLF